VSRETQIVGIVSTILAVLVAVLSVVLPPIKPDQLSALPIVVVVLLLISAVLFFLIVPRGARSNRPAVGGPRLQHPRTVIASGLLERATDRVGYGRGFVGKDGTHHRAGLGARGDHHWHSCVCL
jgi:hypothetical protein